MRPAWPCASVGLSSAARCVAVCAQVGVKTCLVLTGCHSMECESFYRADPTSFFADSVGQLPGL